MDVWCILDLRQSQIRNLLNSKIRRCLSLSVWRLLSYRNPAISHVLTHANGKLFYLFAFLCLHGVLVPFHCLYCSLVWAFNLFRSWHRNRSDEGTSSCRCPVSSSGFPLSFGAICLLNLLLLRHTHAMPPSHWYLTVQGSAGKTNINTTKGVSHTLKHTHTHMQSNENQWILLQKHCRWSLPTSPSVGSSELSLSIAYRRAPNCTQTIGWSGEGMGRTHGPLTIINWPFDAENLPVAVSPVVGHCNYFAVKQETMATINLIHTRAQLPRVTSHQSLRVCCTQLDGPSTFLWQADWLWAYHCLWPYQRQCTVKMSSLCHKRCLPRAP